MREDPAALPEAMEVADRGLGYAGLVAVGRCISWAVLLGVSVLATAVAVGTWLTGGSPMWTAFFLVLVVVFLHGSFCVILDEARLRRRHFQQITERHNLR
jgi:hypothetical protein